MKKDGNKTEEKKEHGNSHGNYEMHHLYEIWDNQAGEVFKYGVSKDPIEEDGLSKRLRKQIKVFNIIAGIFRYIGRILLLDIEGKEKAERIEDEYTDAFVEKYGRLPRGNLKRNRKK